MYCIWMIPHNLVTSSLCLVPPVWVFRWFTVGPLKRIVSYDYLVSLTWIIPPWLDGPSIDPNAVPYGWMVLSSLATYAHRKTHQNLNLCKATALFESDRTVYPCDPLFSLEGEGHACFGTPNWFRSYPFQICPPKFLDSVETGLDPTAPLDCLSFLR